MKQRMLAIMMTLISALLCACSAMGAVPVTATVEAMQTSVPSVASSESVTRGDYPMDYLPGLTEAGVIPVQSHHIGIVVGASSMYAESYEEFCALAKAYEDAFDITASVEMPDETAQLDSIEQMLGNGIDFLIFAPGGAEPLSEVDSLCSRQDVPYMTIGRRIEATPGEGSYVCTIEPDDYLNGVLTGMSIVDTMKAQYGEPFGNIAEITGVVSDNASVLRSRGLRRALAAYDKLNVVCSVAGNDDEETTYKAAINIFKAYREGEIDGIVAPDDGAALTVLQAALDYDRNDVVGRIWSAGATVDGLTGVYYGQIAQTIETAAQTGMAAMEYALTFLEDEADIPPVITSLTRVFTAQTQVQKDGLADIIARLKERGAAYSIESVGEYAIFLPDKNQLWSYYPKRYDTYDDAAAYIDAYEPYTTQKAIYRSQQDNAEAGAS